MTEPPVVVVGAGHNGLVAACYLARAGRRVLVLEAADRPGGGCRTEQTVPQFAFDLHAVAHNIINMTNIPAELGLDELGLDYLAMDPFATGLFADGSIVRFHRDVEQTVESIAEHDPAEARRYRAFMAKAMPLIVASTAGLDPGELGPRRFSSTVAAAWRGLRAYGGPLGVWGEISSPYAATLHRELGSDLTRAPIASFASHASVGPDAPGGAFFALWQAAYHRYGQWHPRGGSQALITALVRRLEASGGELRCGAAAARIETHHGAVAGVVTDAGERIVTDTVITAIDIRTALLELLHPALTGPPAAELAATHRGNAVQFVVHLATDRLPAYPGARPGDWNGLQSHVDSLETLRAGFAAAAAARVPDPPPTYCFTPSALDTNLAPPGRHTVYLACPCAPYEIRGGWESQAESFAESMIDVVERRAPGFRASVLAKHVRDPATMAAELRWPGAHPMHLDISLDQLGRLRPTRRLSRHRVPGVDGLFTCGASTAPVGGIAGISGKAAARAVASGGRRSLS